MRLIPSKRHVSGILTALLLTFGFGVIASPAQAHDAMEASSPEAGSTVEAGMIPIVLTFEEDVMQTADNAGIEVSVVGPAQSEATERTDGCVDSVEGAVITESADIDLPGTYTVNWRSVGSDGHPVEGTFTFEVTNSSGYEASPIVQCNVKATGATNSGANSDEEKYLLGISPTEGLIGGIFLIAIISVFGALSIKRKETERAAMEILKKRRENEK